MRLQPKQSVSVLSTGLCLGVLLCLSQTGWAAILTFDVNILENSTKKFKLRLTGLEITEENDDENVEKKDILGANGNWRGDLTLLPDDGFFNDELQVKGNFFHNSVPAGHQDLPRGEPFAFDLTINADDANEDELVQNSKSQVVPHRNRGHSDKYSAFLFATADTDHNELLNWTFEITGEHDGTVVPEPSGLSLLGLGALGLVRIRRRWRGA